MTKLLLCVLMTGAVFLLGCDPERKKKCEWYLMPEPSLQGTTDPGYIPVCARNLTNNMQYCRLQAKLDFAKKVYGKKFRYVDMVIDEKGRFPRKVTSIETCQ